MPKHGGKVRKYTARDHDFFEGVQVVKVYESDIEFFTPEELQRVLAVAQAAMVPFVAIAAFAGLRHAEIGRLDWSDIQ